MNARFHGPWLLLVHALTPFRLARRGPALHLVLVRTRVESALSADEQRIVSQVDANAAEALTLLERVVNINSGTLNLAGVRRVGDVFRAELDALGFTTTWIDGALFKRAGHLVARRAGSGPRLLLIGHLDTVFEPDSPFQRLERVSDTDARGPGIIDMKGGDVIIVYALKALPAAGALEGRDVTVVMTGDEEDVGRARESRAHRAHRCSEARGRRDRVRGRRRGSEDGHHRAAGVYRLGAARARAARTLVADIQ